MPTRFARLALLAAPVVLPLPAFSQAPLVAAYTGRTLG